MIGLVLWLNIRERESQVVTITKMVLQNLKANSLQRVMTNN
jgi:hypothetical protein